MYMHKCLNMYNLLFEVCKKKAIRENNFESLLKHIVTVSYLKSQMTIARSFSSLFYTWKEFSTKKEVGI